MYRAEDLSNHRRQKSFAAATVHCCHHPPSKKSNKLQVKKIVLKVLKFPKNSIVSPDIPISN
jgi:hypothetical protein